MNEQETKKFFLFGTIGFGVVIVAGLVWAIVAGPDAAVSDRGTDETGLVFDDAGDPSFGPVDSKAVVRVFSDFQCPACKIAEAGFRQASEKYKDKVKFVWNDLPLSSIHPNARFAAVAARCAEDQGKFWEYNGKLFQEQEAWSKLEKPGDTFIGFAGALGLDAEEFAACLSDQRFLAKIQADEREANLNRVQSTPTFFIGNRRVVGALDAAAWEQELAGLSGNP